MRWAGSIILLDMGMPFLNGIEAAKRIRQQSPKSAIIFLTQSDDKDIWDAALWLGPATFVLKVNASRDLCFVIDACLDRS